MKRIDEIDFIKAVAIIMVVIGHTNSPIFIHDMFYLVHVPLFFMMSGCTCKTNDYFFERERVVNFIKRRIVSLYIPFLKYAMPIVILHNLFYNWGFYENGFSINEYILQIIRTILFSIGDKEPLLPQLWFIKVLFIMELLYAFIILMCHKLKIDSYKVIIPISFLSLIFPISELPHFFVMNIMLPLKAMLFFVIGKYIMVGCNYKKFRISRLFLLGILIIWGLSSVFFDTSFQESSGYLALVQVIIVILVSVLLVHIAHLLKKYSQTIYNLILALGGGTMSVFCLHYLVFKIITSLFLLIHLRGTNNNYTELFTEQIPWWAYSLCGVIIPWVLINGGKKIINKNENSYRFNSTLRT